MPVRIHTAVMDKDLERAKEEKNKFLDFEFYVFSFFFPKEAATRVWIFTNLIKYTRFFNF